MAVSTIQDTEPDKVQNEPISVRQTSVVRGVCERALKSRRRWEGCTVKKAMTANRTWEIRLYGITGRPGETWTVRDNTKTRVYGNLAESKPNLMPSETTRTSE